MAIAREFAAAFAAGWIDAWNARDLPHVLAHYSEDFAMSSPFIIELPAEPSGCLRGEENVCAYWEAALSQNPGLHFELLDVFVGADSVVLHYRRNSGEAGGRNFLFQQTRSGQPGGGALQ